MVHRLASASDVGCDRLIALYVATRSQFLPLKLIKGMSKLTLLE